MRSLARIVASALALIAAARAHTWIDCLDTDMMKIYEYAQESIQGNGKPFCGGYIYNYTGHASNPTQQIKVAEMAAGGALCPKPPVYDGWRNRLKVKAGQKYYFGYLENGHITKDHVGIKSYYGTYWTGTPDTSLSTNHDIAPEKLVDGTLYDYDDGTCGESVWNPWSEDAGMDKQRAGEGIPCIGEASLPAGTKPGIYNLVWYWVFHGEGPDGKPDGNRPERCIIDKLDPKGEKCVGGSAYTSCYQVEVVADDAELPAPAPLPADKPNRKSRNPRPPTKSAGGGGGPAATPAPPAETTAAPTPAPAETPAAAANSTAPTEAASPSPVPSEATDGGAGTVKPSEAGADADAKVVLVSKSDIKKPTAPAKLSKKAEIEVTIKIVLADYASAQEDDDEEAIEAFEFVLARLRKSLKKAR